MEENKDEEELFERADAFLSKWSEDMEIILSELDEKMKKEAIGIILFHPNALMTERRGQDGIIRGTLRRNHFLRNIIEGKCFEIFLRKDHETYEDLLELFDPDESLEGCRYVKAFLKKNPFYKVVHSGDLCHIHEINETIKEDLKKFINKGFYVVEMTEKDLEAENDE